ncbi:hypothetical protein HK098_004030 [Nowakowskiella sp. JEL0407]|nr:hypothetical protein HK098_004030 [Nowakowskiella sp. JEL0407]
MPNIQSNIANRPVPSRTPSRGPAPQIPSSEYHQRSQTSSSQSNQPTSGGQIIQPNSSIPSPSNIPSATREEDPFDSQFPKYSRFAANVASLTDRTKNSRVELEKLLQMTKDLQDQVNMQDIEIMNVQNEQQAAKDEVRIVHERIEKLMSEKSNMEQHLQDLKRENDQLEAFLVSYKQ